MGFYAPPPGGQGGGSGGGLAPGHAATGTSQVDDQLASDGSQYAWSRFGPNEQVVLAYGVDGEDFPRVIFPSDPSDALIYWSDGTEDPAYRANIRTAAGFFLLSLPNGTLVALGGNDQIVMYADTHEPLTIFNSDGSQVLFQIGADGQPILTAADNSRHKLTVANDGTLSTVPFP